MSPRRVCRVDKNQGDVKDWLEGFGWFVIDCHEASQYKAMRGFSDLIAICPVSTVFVEVKSGPKEKLTPDEVEFMDKVLAAGGKYAVMRIFENVQLMTNTYWPGRTA